MRTPVKTTLAGLAMALSLVSLAACGGGSDDAAKPKASATPAAEKADLTGIPEVVAVVDDEEISKADFVEAYEAQFTQAQQTAATSGEPVDQDALKKSTADNLVSNRLLLAEADRRTFKATSDDVDKAIADYAEQSGVGTAEAYLAALADQGLDEAKVRSEIESQVKLDQLLADEAGDKKPTKAELQAIYDAAAAQQTEGSTDFPAFEDVQDELKEQAQSEKENAAAEKLLTALREKASITVNL